MIVIELVIWFCFFPKISVFSCIVILRIIKRFAVFSFVFVQVYQVLDQQKQLFALKYVDLLEADDQSTESYKNEIKHLNHLQQHSDQIIKLYD